MTGNESVELVVNTALFLENSRTNKIAPIERNINIVILIEQEMA